MRALITATTRQGRCGLDVGRREQGVQPGTAGVGVANLRAVSCRRITPLIGMEFVIENPVPISLRRELIVMIRLAAAGLAAIFAWGACFLLGRAGAESAAGEVARPGPYSHTGESAARQDRTARYERPVAGVRCNTCHATRPPNLAARGGDSEGLSPGTGVCPRATEVFVVRNQRVFVLKEELGARPSFLYFFDK